MLITAFLFCIIVGVYANRKGHSGLLYFFLSLIFSPLIGGLVAIVVEDKKKIQEAEIERVNEENSITGEVAYNKFKNLHVLKVTGTYSEEEFSLEKTNLTAELKKKNITGSVDDFLGQIAKLVTEDIIDIEDVKSLKDHFKPVQEVKTVRVCKHPGCNMPLAAEWKLDICSYHDCLEKNKAS